MKTIAEVQLRKLAIVLTVLALLLVLWSGVRLLLIAEPESIAPAEASMRIDGIGFGAGQVEEAPSDLSSRPLFWQGREAYTPSVVNNEPGLEVLEGSQRNPAIDDIKLLGIYTGGNKSGAIISFKDERRRLPLMEAVEGWKLVKLEPTEATFESGSNIETLPLEHVLLDPPPVKRGSLGKSRLRKPDQSSSESIEDIPPENRREIPREY